MRKVNKKYIKGAIKKRRYFSISVRYRDTNGKENVGSLNCDSFQYPKLSQVKEYAEEKGMTDMTTSGIKELSAEDYRNWNK